MYSIVTKYGYECGFMSILDACRYAGLLTYKDVIAFIKWKTDINNSDIGHYVAFIYFYDEVKKFIYLYIIKIIMI